MTAWMKVKKGNVRSERRWMMVGWSVSTIQDILEVEKEGLRSGEGSAGQERGHVKDY